MASISLSLLHIILIILYIFSVNRPPRIEYPTLNLVSLGTLNLQRFAMVRIAISIWTQEKWNDEVSKIIFDCRKKSNILEWERNWIKVTIQAFADVKKMKLPSALTDQLEFIVEVVGHELLFFLKYYKDSYSYDSFRKNYIRVEEICWTSYGTIDKVKTHHNFSYRCAMAHIKVACPLCLDDTIIRVWIRVMQNKRLTNFTQNYLSYFSVADPFQLLVFWGNVFKNTVSRLQFVNDPLNMLRRVSGNNKKMAIMSAQEGNIEGFIYFWRKLDDDERSALLPFLMEVFNYPLFRTDKYSAFSEMILFIMNDVDETTKEDVMRRCSFILINGLLEKWPYHGIIVNQFDKIIPHLSSLDYRNIILEILAKMHYIETTRLKHKFYRDEFRLLWGNMEYYVARATNEFMDFLQQRLGLVH